MSHFSPEELANEIVSYFNKQGFLGKLLSKFSQEAQLSEEERKFYSPYKIEYTYWIPKSSKDTAVNTQLYFTVRPSIGIRGREVKLETGFLPLENKSYELKYVQTWEGIRGRPTIQYTALVTRKIEEINNTIKVTVRIENITSVPEDLSESSMKVLPSFFEFSVTEQLEKTTFIESPDKKGRYFITDGVIARETKPNQSSVTFFDYAMHFEQIPKPKESDKKLLQSLEKIYTNEKLKNFNKKLFEALKYRNIETFWEYQEKSIKEITDELEKFESGKSPEKVFLLNAATAGGKTEAFLVPIFAYCYLHKVIKREKGVKALLFYPTKALCNDQFDRIIQYLSFLNKNEKSKITVGVFHGDVISIWNILDKCPKCDESLEINPKNTSEAICSNEQCRSKYELEKVQQEKVEIKCPLCREILKTVFVPKIKDKGILANYQINFECPKCKEKVGRIDYVKAIREDVFSDFPDILIVNPDIIHYSISRVPEGRLSDMLNVLRIYSLFGRETKICSNCKNIFFRFRKDDKEKCNLCGNTSFEIVKSNIGFLVVDEIHMLRGNTGCNASEFFSVLQYILEKLNGKLPIRICATATVKNSKDLPANIFGVNPDADVIIEEPEYEPNVFFKEKPRYHLFILPKGESTLSAVRAALEAIYCEEGSDGSLVARQSRLSTQVLTFFDSKRDLYTFYATLHPPFKHEIQVEQHTADLGLKQRKFIENNFNKIEPSTGLPYIQILLATSTLEVGVDFDKLRILFNFGAPFSYNTYLQRIGRVGRRANALIVCFLRYNFPLDNYYFENYGELIEFKKENVDIVPVVRDIPKAVRRFVFTLTSAIGILSTEPDFVYPFSNVNMFYNQVFEKKYNELLKVTKNCFLRGPILRKNEVAEEIENVFEKIKMELEKKAVESLTKPMNLNDALDEIAQNDETSRLDFNLRSNEEEATIEIIEPWSFLRIGSITEEQEPDVFEEEIERPS